MKGKEKKYLVTIRGPDEVKIEVLTRLLVNNLQQYQIKVKEVEK